MRTSAQRKQHELGLHSRNKIFREGSIVSGPTRMPSMMWEY